MIGREKLGMRALKSEKMKTISPRNPLTDLNSQYESPRLAKTEDQKGRDNSYSKCQTRAPKLNSYSKCLPRALSSKTLASPSSFQNKNRSKRISGNSPKVRSSNPAKPTTQDVCPNWNQPGSASRLMARGKSIEPNTKFKNASRLNFTPDKRLLIEEITPCSGVKEGKQNLSDYPRSSSTPPIEASISPEVCAYPEASTPVCFAIGHGMAGVRRKCRPRGILTIVEEQKNTILASSAPPPLAEASVCWFSSALEHENRYGMVGPRSEIGTVDFHDEVHIEREIGVDSAKERPSIMDYEYGMEKTPSSSTSNSNASPFSLIVKRAEACSMLYLKGEYGHDRVSDISLLSDKYRSNISAISTPSLGLDSNTNNLKEIASKSALDGEMNDFSPSRDLYLKSDCQQTPSNSIDQNKFKNLHFNELNLSVADARKSQLLCRNFETGELNYHQCSYDDNDRDADFASECIIQSKYCTSLEKGNGFGSYEYPFEINVNGDQKCQLMAPQEVNSFAESFSTDGGFISSGDSDWTLFYRSNLFEL